MAQYIPKDALVAEIKRIYKQYEKQINSEYMSTADFMCIELKKILSLIDTIEVKKSKLPNPHFPHLNNIVDKVFGRGNLESLEYDEAEQLVLLAKEELLKDLEVKEVDLCEEEERIWKDFNMGERHLSKNDLEKISKHFFGLGLKAQHDNWKMVDNTNLPQSDKNKIYCVFTKDRYILATVINHPQDEDLLQWKCTEFPHHRYDMCEGDKYMQIV